VSHRGSPSSLTESHLDLPKGERMKLAEFKQRPETITEWDLVPADERAVMKEKANEDRDEKSKDIKTGHQRLQQANEFVTDICATVSTLTMFFLYEICTNYICQMDQLKDTCNVQAALLTCRTSPTDSYGVRYFATGNVDGFWKECFKLSPLALGNQLDLWVLKGIAGTFSEMYCTLI
jgi:hypothetical protein